MTRQQAPGYGQGREALIRATIEVVARSGLRGMTFRAVAEAAGVRNSLISYHFGTSEELLVATAAWAVEASLRRTIPAEGAGDWRFIHDLIATVRADPDLQLFHYEVLIASRRSPELSQSAETLTRGYLEALETLVRERGHPRPEVLARLIHAVLDGMVFQLLTTPELPHSAEALELLADMLRR